MVVHAASVQRHSADTYQAGACNIGPAEIARRRWSGHVGTLLTVALLVVLLVIGAPAAWRLTLAIPAAMAAIGYLQAYLRFCAAYGFWGVFNFGELGRRHDVLDRDSLARDRRRAARIALGGVAVGILVALVAVAL